jgi:nucleoporin GLE1
LNIQQNHIMANTSEYAAFMKQLKNTGDHAFHQALDDQMSTQRSLHITALEQALAQHTAVRQEAERALEQHQLEEHRRRLHEQEQERSRLAEIHKRLLVEQEMHRHNEMLRQREKDEAQRLIERQRQEELNREAERKEAQLLMEKEAAAAAEQKAREETANAVAAQEKAAQAAQIAKEANRTATSVTATPMPTSQQSTNHLITSPMQQRQSIHADFRALHLRLKAMRKQVLDECKQGPIKGLKNQVSDWRRSIGKCCGQLSPTNKEGNRRAMKEVENILDAAGQVQPQPMVDASQFVVNNPGNVVSGPASGITVYLLNILAKKIVAQFGYEAAINPASADPIGIMAVATFANVKYQINGTPLIDILWAKYHRACPALFGINAPETTDDGRKMLGWAQEDDERTGKRIWVSGEAHYSRMRGLAAGFAALTLRDFSKSTKKSPVPNHLYWEAVARIVNMKALPQQQTASQYAVLKGLTDVTFIPRAIDFWGKIVMAVLHAAFVELPRSATPQNRSNVNFNGCLKQLESMPEILQRDLFISLEA